VRRPGLYADGLRGRGDGLARQCDRRADRQPVDGGRGIAGHSICRRRLRTDRGVRLAAVDACLQTDRAWRKSAMTALGIHARRLVLLAIGIVVVISLPLVVTSSFAIDIFIRILLFAFIGTAWNLMGGYAKQLSLGHAAYFGLGAYTSTILQIDYDVSPWIAMVAGGGVGGVASPPAGRAG